jgi:hypothetical protein
MIIRHGVKKFYKRENNIRAKESRLLAIIAIVVSFVTLIATIISIWCN